MILLLWPKRICGGKPYSITSLQTEIQILVERAKNQFTQEISEVSPRLMKSYWMQHQRMFSHGIIEVQNYLGYGNGQQQTWRGP